MNWYLLQTKPHAHITACDHLRRQSFDVFLPLITKTTKQKGKFLDITAPLFPGYLFLGTSIDPVPWKSINGTRGVSKAVTLDGSTAPWHSYYRGLKRCDDAGFSKLNDIVGRSCQNWKGPGVYLYHSQIKDDKRAWVLIDILQQQTRARSLEDVSKIN